MTISNKPGISEEVSPFIYAHHAVCAIEAENEDIYTGFCIESSSGRKRADRFITSDVGGER